MWPHGTDHATKLLTEFGKQHLKRSLGFNDLRASFVTSGFAAGLTAEEESKLAGHGPDVAQKYYSEYRAHEARYKLPDDPLAKKPDSGGGDDDGSSDLKRRGLRLAK